MDTYSCYYVQHIPKNGVFFENGEFLAFIRFIENKSREWYGEDTSIRSGIDRVYGKEVAEVYIDPGFICNHIKG